MSNDRGLVNTVLHVHIMESYAATINGDVDLCLLMRKNPNVLSHVINEQIINHI